MEFTSTVLYQHRFIYYNVLTRDGKTFVARLLKNKPYINSQPPHEIHLQWDGENWVATAQEDLIYYLSFDIQKKYALYVAP